MKTNNREQLLQLLKNAGWFPGRDVRENYSGSPLLNLLPPKVLDIYYEFGELKRISVFQQNREVRFFDLSDSVKEFNDSAVVDFYIENTFKEGNEIDLEKGENYIDYRYSVLIGTQLYSISSLVDKASMLMDADGNVYLIDTLGELSWIASNFLDGLEELLFGLKYYIPFYEETVEWIFSEGETPVFIPPINKSLNGRNPFLYKKQYPEK